MQTLQVSKTPPLNIIGLAEIQRLALLVDAMTDHQTTEAPGEKIILLRHQV